MARRPYKSFPSSCVRVTDWRWNLAPLSPAGSIHGIGGRFNIGVELHRARGQAFPALYIACDVDTANREYFGAPPDSSTGQLSTLEFALRTESSFTTFALQTRLEQVFDLRDASRLEAFVQILARFGLSNDTKAFARSAKLQPRDLVRTPKKLWTLALTPPAIWRWECQMFGIPVPGQMLGRFVRDAGFEAILYPSQQGGGDCLAVFPENFKASNSEIRVVGNAPAGASCTILDRHPLCLEGLASYSPPSRAQ